MPVQAACFPPRPGREKGRALGVFFLKLCLAQGARDQQLQVTGSCCLSLGMMCSVSQSRATLGSSMEEDTRVRQADGQIAH